MASKLPPIDPDLPEEDAAKRAVERDYEILEKEAQLKDLSVKEARQRYRLRWLATFVGIGVLGVMIAILWHLSHLASQEELPTESAAFLVALVVCPISSITAITIALFVGAFKKFEDVDVEKAGQAANAGAAVSRVF